MKTIFIFISLVWLIQSNVYSQTSFTASQAYNGVYATGEYEVFSNSGNNIPLSSVHKPIIVVEGFDPNNEFNIPYIYSLFSTLANDLQNDGYDIIILKFDNAGDYIQRNAYLLMELINQVNTNKPNSNDKLVVVGYSMGGLVARYALTYMEANSMDHQTRLYVSFDAPHKGAHVPASVQALALTFNYSAYFTMFPGLQAAINQFTCPAAQQMLKYRISSPTQTACEIPISSTYTTFMNELNTLNTCNGFPTTCRNIALSLGSWNQVGQRSNLTLNNLPSGVKDLQVAGFPQLFINFPASGSGNTSIWDMSQCQAIGTFSFQSYCSNEVSTNYPYYSNPGAAYINLGIINNPDPTYWYYNPGNIIGAYFPSGSWATSWWYGDSQEPRDFAPGSNIPIYDEILGAINPAVNCSFSYASNSTFIPTVSALAFDTDDLFYDIYDDPNKLDKTPFDAIYGETGDNLSHMTDQTTDPCLVTWLVNEINGNYNTPCVNNNTVTDQSCATGTVQLSGTITSGQNVSVSNVSDIEATNYVVNSGATVTLQAADRIVLKPGSHAASGSHFTAKITPCSSKSCAWVPSNSMLKTNPSENNVWYPNMNIINNDVPQLSSINQINNQQNPNIDIYPNPAVNNLTIESPQSAIIEITNIQGQLIKTFTISGKTNIDISSLPSGVYIIEAKTDKEMTVKKFVKE